MNTESIELMNVQGSEEVARTICPERETIPFSSPISVINKLQDVVVHEEPTPLTLIH